MTRMQLGHQNSNHPRPLAGPRLSDRALRFGDLQKEDPRFSQLDLRISGESCLMRNLKTLILRASDCNATILITGESGTGKELVARSIHDFGQRQREPFLAINCGALPESLIESELFGHRRGSFTGADEHRVGLFEVANGGTLFLDEIGELPKPMQAKLLRFLESGEIRRVGENDARLLPRRRRGGKALAVIMAAR